MRGLSTKILTAIQRVQAENLGLNLIERAFIEVRPCLGSLFDEQGRPHAHLLNTPADAWLLTSRQALVAVEALKEYVSPPSVAVVGQKTALRLTQMGITPKVVASSAAELANRILGETNWQHLHFFCGNLRREELPQALHAAGKSVQEWTVYQTELTSHKIEGDYAFVLFFSPSGVASFLQQNTWQRNMLGVAIGPTTAQAFHAATGQQAAIADAPTVEAVLQRSAHLFSPTL